MLNVDYSAASPLDAMAELSGILSSLHAIPFEERQRGIDDRAPGFLKRAKPPPAVEAGVRRILGGAAAADDFAPSRKLGETPVVACRRSVRSVAVARIGGRRVAFHPVMQRPRPGPAAALIGAAGSRDPIVVTEDARTRATPSVEPAMRVVGDDAISPIAPDCAVVGAHGARDPFEAADTAPRFLDLPTGQVPASVTVPNPSQQAER